MSEEEQRPYLALSFAFVDIGLARRCVVLLQAHERYHVNDKLTFKDVRALPCAGCSPSYFSSPSTAPHFFFSHSFMIKIDIRASCSRHCSMARAGCGRRRLCVKANVSTGGRGTAAKVRNTILFSQNNINPITSFLFSISLFSFSLFFLFFPSPAILSFQSRLLARPLTCACSKWFCIYNYVFGRSRKEQC